MDIKQIKTTIRIAGTDVPAPLYSLAFRIGQGAPEATEIVLEQIGRSDLYWAWEYARKNQQTIQSRVNPPPTSEHEFFNLLTPESQDLIDANRKTQEAWQPIQALIDVAREHIETLGHDGAPS